MSRNPATRPHAAPRGRHHATVAAFLWSLLLCAAAHAATGGTANVKIVWLPNPEPDVAGYRVLYGTESGNPTASVDAGPTTSVTLDGLDPGATYYLRVVAYNRHGLEGVPSEEIAHTLSGGTVGNQPPVADSASFSTYEDIPLPFVLGGSDPDGDPLSYSIVAGPAHGTLSGTPPTLVYTPHADFHGSDRFTFRTRDGAESSATATVALTVLPVNDPPMATSADFTTPEDTALSLVLGGSDPDGDPLSYSIVAGPDHGTLSGTPPALVYTPHADFHGSDRFTFRTSDGAESSATATVSLTVLPVNDPPVASAAHVRCAAGAQVEITLRGYDPDGDPLAFSIGSGPSHGTLTGSPPDLIYRPADGFLELDQFTFTANDGTAGSPPATVILEVGTENNPPVAFGRTLETVEDEAVDLSLIAYDPDDDPLDFSVVDPPARGVLEGEAPHLRYIPNNGFHGEDRFTFLANDGRTDSKTATVVIRVVPKNLPPVGHDQDLLAVRNTSKNIVLTGSDPDGDPLTYSIVDPPLNGTLSGTPPAVSYRPKQGFSGTDRFTFRVHDGTVHSATATVRLTVKHSNTRPTGKAMTLGTTENTAMSITLTGADNDGDALSYLISAQPKNGRLYGTPPDLIYRPKAGFRGTDRFTFRTNDGIVNSNAAAVDIVVGAALASSSLPPPVAEPALSFDAARTSSGNDIELAVTGRPGEVYVIEFSSNLRDWETLRPVIVEDPAGLRVSLPVDPSASGGFYRLRLPED